MISKPFINTCKRCGRRFYSASRAIKICIGCKNEDKPIKDGRKHYSRLRINRLLVYKRDDYHCQCCGDYKKIVIHHIDCDFRNNEMDNLITLCNQCHHSIHRNYTRRQLKKYDIYKLFPPKIRWGIFGKRLIYSKWQLSIRR